MSNLKRLFYAFCYNDFEIFSNFNLVYLFYFLVFVILFLENGVLLAAFLPGDSLLIFIGILISKGILNFSITLSVFTIAAILGSWISYLQGKFLEKNKYMMRCLFFKFPEHYYHRAYEMFHNHGLFALIIGRFVMFVRTILPIIIGCSGLNSSRFHFFNCISAFLWVFILILLGFFLGSTTFFQCYGHKLIFFVILLLLTLFIVSCVSYIVIYLLKK